MWAALKLQASPKALTRTLGLTQAAFIFPDQQCPPDFKFQRATQNSWPASYLGNGILTDLSSTCLASLIAPGSPT